MRSSFLALVLALAASANAKTVNRNGVSMDVSACAVELQNVDNHINEVAINLSGYTSNLLHATEIQASHYVLEEALKVANKQCSAIDGGLSHADASSILDAANKLSPSIDLLSTAVMDKKSEINQLPEVNVIVKNDIKQVKELTTSIMNTLVTIFPEEMKESANVHVKKINSLIEQAEQAYFTL